MSLPIHAVGVGPGDPELLTLKGARLIRDAQVVVVPVGRADAASHALSIAEGNLDPSRQEIFPLVFPMTKDRTSLETAWGEAARRVLDQWRSGKRIVILTIGDPMLYSTTLHLCRSMTVLEPGIQIRYVPGVSSITASAARGGLPLGTGDERCAILPGDVTDEELETLCGSFETLVFMKVSRRLEKVISGIRRLWPAATLLLASRVGTGAEMVSLHPEELGDEQVEYLSTLIVRRSPFFPSPHGGDS